MDVFNKISAICGRVGGPTDPTAYDDTEYDADVVRAIRRMRECSPTINSDGKWLMGGFIAYFQSVYDVVRACDPTLPAGLPDQCLDPVRTAEFFGLPLMDFDWIGYRRPSWDYEGTLRLGEKTWHVNDRKDTVIRVLLDELEGNGWPSTVNLASIDPDRVRDAAKLMRRKTGKSIYWSATSAGFGWRLLNEADVTVDTPVS